MKAKTAHIILVDVPTSEHKAIISNILMKENLKQEEVVIIETKEQLQLHERNIKHIPIMPLEVLETNTFVFEEKKKQKDIKNQNKLRARHYKK